MPQYPRCLPQEVNTRLPHNHGHAPVPCGPQLYLLWPYAEQQRAGSALKPQTVALRLNPKQFLTVGEPGVSTVSTAALGKPRLCEHSELDLPNMQECGHHSAVILQMWGINTFLSKMNSKLRDEHSPHSPTPKKMFHENNCSVAYILPSYVVYSGDWQYFFVNNRFPIILLYYAKTLPN